MTIEQLNKWQDIIRGYNNSPINYEDMVEKSAKEGLVELVVFLNNNHYIAKMKDGNTFINWSRNNYYPEATIINLKAELNGQARPATIEERVSILEERIKVLEEKINIK